jgi:hypothetical protein
MKRDWKERKKQRKRKQKEEQEEIAKYWLQVLIFDINRDLEEAVVDEQISDMKHKDRKDCYNHSICYAEKIGHN